jgi:hypothetical protein
MCHPVLSRVPCPSLPGLPEGDPDGGAGPCLSC